VKPSGISQDLERLYSHEAGDEARNLRRVGIFSERTPLSTYFEALWVVGVVLLARGPKAEREGHLPSRGGTVRS
jgi:hypothetical protein